MSTPSTPLLTPSDQEGNRRVWAEWLRRPDWRMIPRSRGHVRECHCPLDVGYELARAWWPLSGAIIDEYLDPADIEDAILMGCYGLNEIGEFDPAEIPDRGRGLLLMAEQAARSAPSYLDRDTEVARNILENLPGDLRWYLYALSHALTLLWEYDPSPMRGTVLDPDATARLIADILDAAQLSLLEPALPEFDDE